MDSLHTQKPHAVCVPYPLQGHVNPCMQLAKLLHCMGIHITFVNTEFNHKRLIKSLGEDYVKGLPDFRFETIPDGLPPSESDKDASQDVVMLCESTRKNCYAPFKELVMKLNNSSPEVPPVSCIIVDCNAVFAVSVAIDLGIPEIQVWTASACGFIGYLQFDELIERGILPLKDCLRSSAVIINTFEELEDEAIAALKAKNPNIYNIGPLHLLDRHFPEKEIGFKVSGSSLWKNDTQCIKWLDKWEPNSVLYVNYGSITVMTKHHLTEFAWGIANSKLPFLWIMRPDVVMGETITLPPEFLEETKDRGYITSWCFQDKVLAHPSVGVFLTHCGWNSTLETISSGVPTICWPFFAEQQTNCRYLCNMWKIGMEINEDAKREEISVMVKEMMNGEKGKEMRQKCLDWKEKAEYATNIGGSSYNDFINLAKALHHNVI